jgi:DNA-directed RNA polymerase subunit alpha
MVDTLIDLKSLLVDREDCDAGTVQKLREALAQGGDQSGRLRGVIGLLETKMASASRGTAKAWRLKRGIASFFLGQGGAAIEDLRAAEGALACFYLGQALADRQEFDEALQAFDNAEKAGYASAQVQLMRVSIHRQKGEMERARQILGKLENLSSHSGEYHYQFALCLFGAGERVATIEHLERAVELEPSHSGALFQLGHANDLAGNDDEAIDCYERCLRYPPVHVGVLMNLGVLYEDQERFDKAVDCYRKVLNADPLNAQARLFLKDAEAATTMYYSPDEQEAASHFSQVLEIPIGDFELSTRNRNCLGNMHIRTLGDLTRVSEQQLMNTKNFGETSLQELKDMMASKGLRLGQALMADGPFGMLSDDQPPAAVEPEVLNTPVGALDLSVRSRKCTYRLGIRTLGELVQRSADELLELRNFGMTSLNEVRQKLAERGLRLRGD